MDEDRLNEIAEEIEEIKNGELYEAQERHEYVENGLNTDEYDEMLDDCHGEFMGYVASQILKHTDPTAYRCGLADYNDEELNRLSDEINDFKAQIQELETEAEELKEEVA